MNYEYDKLGLRRVMGFKARYKAHLGILCSAIVGLILDGYSDTPDSTVYSKCGKFYKLRNVLRDCGVVRFELVECPPLRSSESLKATQLSLFDLDV
jgi:hypothetical protein